MATAPFDVRRAVQETVEEERKKLTPPPSAAVPSFVPPPMAPVITGAAQKHSVPADELALIARQESNFNPRAVNRESGAEGMFQQHPPAHPQYKVGTGDPNYQTDYAAARYRELLNRYGGDREKATTAWYGGAGTIDRAIARNPEAWQLALPPRTAKYNRDTNALRANLGALSPVQAAAAEDAGIRDLPVTDYEPKAATPAPKALTPPPADPAVLEQMRSAVRREGYESLNPLEKGAYIVTEPLKRGWQMAGQTSNIVTSELGVESTQEAATDIAIRTKALREMGTPFYAEEARKRAEGKGIAGSFVEMMRDPRAAIDVGLESFTSSLASLIGGAAAGFGLGAAGANPFTAAAGTAAGAGLGSFAVDYGSEILAAMQEAGVDLTNPEAVQAALENPDLMHQARVGAVAHGLPVAAFDALSAGMAGKLIRPVMAATGGRAIVSPLAAGVAELAQQATLGGVGEATGQLAKAGEVYDPYGVAAEIVGEIPSGAVETATGVGRDLLTRPPAPPAGPAAEATAAAVAAGAVTPPPAASEPSAQQAPPEAAAAPVSGDVLYGPEPPEDAGGPPPPPAGPEPPPGAPPAEGALGKAGPPSGVPPIEGRIDSQEPPRVEQQAEQPAPVVPAGLAAPEGQPAQPAPPAPIERPVAGVEPPAGAAEGAGPTPALTAPPQEKPREEAQPAGQVRLPAEEARPEAGGVQGSAEPAAAAAAADAQAAGEGLRPIVQGKVETQRGTKIPAPPRRDTPTGTKDYSAWLLKQARHEAAATKDEAALKAFHDLKPNKLTSDDFSDLSNYLFGQEDVEFAHPERQPGKPKKPPKPLQGDPQRDSLLAFLAKTRGHGRLRRGLDLEEAVLQGIDPAHSDTRGYAMHRVFHKGGMSFDQAAELLAEAGYPVHSRNAQGQMAPDLNVVLDLVSKELAGTKAYSDRYVMPEPEPEPEPIPPEDYENAGVPPPPESEAASEAQQVSLVQQVINIDPDAAADILSEVGDDPVALEQALREFIDRSSRPADEAGAIPEFAEGPGSTEEPDWGITEEPAAPVTPTYEPAGAGQQAVIPGAEQVAPGPTDAERERDLVNQTPQTLHLTPPAPPPMTQTGLNLAPPPLPTTDNKPRAAAPAPSIGGGLFAQPGAQPKVDEAAGQSALDALLAAKPPEPTATAVTPTATAAAPEQPKSRARLAAEREVAELQREYDAHKFDSTWPYEKEKAVTDKLWDAQSRLNAIIAQEGAAKPKQAAAPAPAPAKSRMTIEEWEQGRSDLYGQIQPIEHELNSLRHRRHTGEAKPEDAKRIKELNKQRKALGAKFEALDATFLKQSIDEFPFKAGQIIRNRDSGGYAIVTSEPNEHGTWAVDYGHGGNYPSVHRVNEEYEVAADVPEEIADRLNRALKHEQRTAAQAESQHADRGDIFRGHQNPDQLFVAVEDFRGGYNDKVKVVDIRTMKSQEIKRDYLHDYPAAERKWRDRADAISAGQPVEEMAELPTRRIALTDETPKLEADMYSEPRKAMQAWFKDETKARDLRRIREAMEIYERLSERNEPGDEEANAAIFDTINKFFADQTPENAVAFEDAVWSGLQQLTGEEDPDEAALLENEVFASARDAGELIFDTVDPQTASFNAEELNTAFGMVEFRRPVAGTFPTPPNGARVDHIGSDRKGVKTGVAAGPFVTPEQAVTTIDGWKAHALAIGAEKKHGQQVIVSLFDRTGLWSQPWKDAGFKVITADVQTGQDLMNFGQWMDEVEALIDEGYEISGVLAAPPCTSFAVSGNRYWKEHHATADPDRVAQKYGEWAKQHFERPIDYANTLVAVVKLFVAQANPRFYAMENPLGRINDQNNLPLALLSFTPHAYGDPYTKKTGLWGEFNPNLPLNNVEPSQGSKIHKLRGDDPEEKLMRSETPLGFAYAFFEANYPIVAEMLPEGEDVKPPIGVFSPVMEGEKPAVPEQTTLDVTAEPGAKGIPPSPNNLHIVKAAYPSGMSRPGDFDAALAAESTVGVDLSELSYTMLAKVAQAANSGTPIFVDSGAFAAFRKGERIDVKETMDKYVALIRQLDDTGLDNISIVAPDIVGEPGLTLGMIGGIAKPLVELTHAGVNVIVPVQTSEGVSASYFVERLLEVLNNAAPNQGVGPFTLGIPSNAAAMSDKQFRDMLAKHRPSQIHILGAADRAKAEARLKAIDDVLADQEVTITLDANVIRSTIAKANEAPESRQQAIEDMLRTKQPARTQVVAGQYDKKWPPALFYDIASAEYTPTTARDDRLSQVGEAYIRLAGQIRSILGDKDDPLSNRPTKDRFDNWLKTVPFVKGESFGPRTNSLYKHLRAEFEKIRVAARQRRPSIYSYAIENPEFKFGSLTDEAEINAMLNRRLAGELAPMIEKMADILGVAAAPMSHKQLADERAATAPTPAPWPKEELPRDKPISEVVFDQDERVVVNSGELAGRHGRVVKVETVKWKGYLGAGTKTTTAYVVETDAGTVETYHPADLTREEGKAPPVDKKDVLFDGRYIPPEQMQHMINLRRRERDQAQAKLDRARTPDSKAKHAEARDLAEGKIRQAEDALNAWLLQPAPPRTVTVGQTTVAVRPNKIVTDEKADEALKTLLSMKGQLNAGIDPKLAEAGLIRSLYHIERGAHTFAAYVRAMVGELGRWVTPYLKQWYFSVQMDPQNADIKDAMTPPQEMFAADIEEILTGEPNEIRPEPVPTGDREDAAPQDEMGEEGVSPVGPEEAGLSVDGSGQPEGEGVRPGVRAGVPDVRAPVRGERGDQQVRGGERAAAPEGVPAGSDVDTGSDQLGNLGLFTDEAADLATEEDDDATARRIDLDTKKRLQREAESIDVKFADPKNIADTLPILFPTQHQDVLFAERRFATPTNYGVLFANGTGTGKTFVGAGIIKRMLKAGTAKNVLILTPDQEVMDAWVRAGELVNLKITPLAGTADPGRGVSVTTYANFSSNDSLISREYQLLVPDEAHNLGKAKDGKETIAMARLRALALHPRGIETRVRMKYPELWSEIKSLNAKLRTLRNAMSHEYQNTAERLRELNRQYQQHVTNERAYVESQQGEKRPRVVFLSATPFAYERNVDNAEGFLFELPTTGENVKNVGPLGAYLIENFGWRVRYNKLTEPGPEVDRSIMQREWNMRLRRSGAMSVRMLDVEADYGRKFVLLESKIGQAIDEGLEWLRSAENGKYRRIYNMVADRFDFLSRRRLLESLKAREAIPYIKKQHALGRKVVVFYDYTEGGGFNIFDIPVPEGETYIYDGTDDAKDGKKQTLQDLIREFKAKRPDLVKLDTRGESPLVTLMREFPNAGQYNGVISKGLRKRQLADFNSDSIPEANLILANKASNAGWSAHDTTGAHQRVLINLGLPTAPVEAIQQEGRIYRVGQATDAIFRYFNTGTNWERTAFAGTIAYRASTAENLAMGEQARGLRDSFVEGFTEAEFEEPGEGDGVGSKARDRELTAAITPYERAKTFFFGQLRKTARTKAAEGVDYFATPEPLGFKMVEWADVRPGESGLEPSAGHGAIARWLPDRISKTAIEPSPELTSRLRLVVDGGTTRVIEDTFENHNVVNKYDVVVMNPPYGTGGKTAMDHIIKATTHLKDHGRIVAIVPDGPAMQKRLESWLYGESEQPAKPLFTTDAGPVYKGDTIETSLSWAPGGVVTRKDKFGSLFIRVKPGVEQAVDPRYVTSVQPTGKRTEIVKPGEGFYLTAEILLPSVTFSRAGTAVNTKVIVLDKVPEASAAPQPVSRDLRDATSFNELFDRLERTTVPERTKAREAEVETPAHPQATPTEAPKHEPVTFRTREGHHTQKNVPLFYARHQPDRLPNEHYKQLAAIAKKWNGFWESDSKWNNNDGGWRFWKAEDRAAFMAEATGEQAPQAARRKPIDAGTPEFRKWFDRSVMSKAGKPVVMYHHTYEDFDAIEPGGYDPRLSGPAIWLTSEPDANKSNFAHQTDWAIRNGAPRLTPDRSMFVVTGVRTIPVYVSLQHPKIFRAAEKTKIAWLPEDKVYALKVKGYDGAIAYNEDGTIWEAVVFNSNQVKSVFNETPTDDPRLMFAREIPKPTKPTGILRVQPMSVSDNKPIGRPTAVRVNPLPATLLNELRISVKAGHPPFEYRWARLNTGDVYVWDAQDATHFNIANALRLLGEGEASWMGRDFGFIELDGGRLKASDNHGISDIPLSEVLPNQIAARRSYDGRKAMEAARNLEAWTNKVAAHLEKRKAAAKAARIEIVRSLDELRQILDDNGEQVRSGTKGVFIRGDNRIYLVAEELESLDEADRIFTHEAIGHMAMERYAVMADAIKAALQLEATDKTIAGLWAQVRVDEHDKTEYQQAKEVVARLAEGTIEHPLIDRAVAALKRMIRSWGINLEFSKRELRGMIASAARRQMLNRPSPVERRSDIAEQQIHDILAARRTPGTPAQAQRIAVDGLRRGVSLEYLMRLPFQMLGMLNERGELAFGVRSSNKLEQYIKNWKANPEGPFRAINPILEKARWGLLDRYGVPESAIEAGHTAESRKRAILAEGWDVLKKVTATISDPAEAKILQEMLTGEAVDVEKFRSLRDEIRYAIDALSMDALNLGLISRESYERNRGTYLHRVYLEHERQRAERGSLRGWMANTLHGRRARIQGSELMGRGMFWDVTQERLLRDVDRKDWDLPGGAKMVPGKPDPAFLKTKWRVLDLVKIPGEGTLELEGIENATQKAKVERRVWWPASLPIPPRLTDYTDRGVFEVREVKAGKFVMWRDFTKEERDQMGEILDARYTLARMFQLFAQDLSSARYFKDIADNPDATWPEAEGPPPANTIAPEGRASTAMIGYEWVKVPSSEIPGTGGKKKWGALAGRYVRVEVWKDLNEYDRMNQQGPWQSLLEQWKLNKTARNPVVHMNNLISNLLLADMVDVTIRDIIDGMRLYLENDGQGEARKRAEQYGAFGYGYADMELNKHLHQMLEGMAKENRAGLYEGFAGRLKFFDRFARIASEGLVLAGKADEKMIDAYSASDDIFRMATFVKYERMGFAPGEAARMARDEYMNYDIRAPWINAARRSVLPFLAYSYRAIPVIVNAMMRRPWKLAKYALLAEMANVLAYAITGDDEDWERRTMAKRDQGRSWMGGAPYMMKLPYHDQNDNPMFLDIRRWIPAGDVFDQNQQGVVPIPTWLHFGGPLMIAAEILLNRSAFTGEDIINPLSDDTSDAMRKYANHLWKSGAPSAPWVPGSWYWDKISRSIGGLDAMQRELSTPQALASAVGIKARAHDPIMQMRATRFDYEKRVSALRAELRVAARQQQRRLISEADFKDVERSVNDKLATINEDFVRRMGE